MQKCKSAYGLCKGAKVKSENRVRITEKTTEGDSWLEYRVWGEGRDVASPRPPGVGGQGEALPLPAGGARERQRAPTGSDTFRMPNEVRPHGS